MGDLNSARSLQYLRQPTTPVGSPRASAEPPKLESAKVVKFQAAGSNANGKYCIEYQVYGAASVVQSIWRTLSAFDSLHKVLHEWNHWVPSIAGFAFFNGQEKKLEQLNKFLAALVARPVRGSQSDSALDQFFGLRKVLQTPEAGFNTAAASAQAARARATALVDKVLTVAAALVVARLSPETAASPAPTPTSTPTQATPTAGGGPPLTPAGASLLARQRELQSAGLEREVRLREETVLLSARKAELEQALDTLQGTLQAKDADHALALAMVVEEKQQEQAQAVEEVIGEIEAEHQVLARPRPPESLAAPLASGRALGGRGRPTVTCHRRMSAVGQTRTHHPSLSTHLQLPIIHHPSSHLTQSPSRGAVVHAFAARTALAALCTCSASSVSLL
jgi:hypothetical protein